MSEVAVSQHTSIDRFRRYGIVLIIAWTMIVIASWSWNIFQLEQQTLEIARVHARVAYQKDVIFRRWASLQGGVYVPVSSNTSPNPYLEVAERDITSPSGKALTLMNPAYITRQIYDLQNQELGVRGHITSLRPIRPQNAPDEWEARALKSFEEGATEASTIATLDGNPYMRLMRPLITEPSCLACHAKQGYQVGQIRGGISIAIPMEPLLQIKQNNFQSLTLAHLAFWILGTLGIIVSGRRIEKSEFERAHAEEQLRFISSHDALSGLFNRASYEDQVARLEHSDKAPISVMIADVDGLKTMNDLHGHAAGDELIKRAANVLKAATRVEDIVARIGGDEFAVLLPSADEAATRRILTRINAQLAHDHRAHPDAPLEFSIGWATTENAGALRPALKVADARMYAEKKSRASRARED